MPRAELGIHGLNRWTVKCIEMYENRGVQAAFKVTTAERDHRHSGAREALLAPDVPFAAGLPHHVPCRVLKLALFSGSIPHWLVPSHNMPTINTTDTANKLALF